MAVIVNRNAEGRIELCMRKLRSQTTPLKVRYDKQKCRQRETRLNL